MIHWIAISIALSLTIYNVTLLRPKTYVMTIRATTLELTPASSGLSDSPDFGAPAGFDSLCLAHEWMPLAETVFS